LTDTGTRIAAVPGDVSDPIVGKLLVDEAVRAFGRLDHLATDGGYTAI